MTSSPVSGAAEKRSLKERVLPLLKRMVGTAKKVPKTFLFPNPDSAAKFMLSVFDTPRELWSSPRFLDSLANTNNGMLTTDGFRDRSSTGREAEIYGHQTFIHVQDREYLFERDPTARMIVSRVPEDTWVTLPRTYDEGIDAFFEQLMDMAAHVKIAAGDESQRMYGAAFLYLDCTGEASQELTPRDKLMGIDIIEAKEVAVDKIVLYKPGEERHPLCDHGIKSIQFSILAPNEVRVVKKDEPEPNHVIHGSRIRLLREGKRGRSIIARPVVDVIFDALRDLRDFAFSLRMAQMQGNPIALDIDTEQGFHLAKEIQTAIKENMEDFQDNQRDVFGGIAGVKVRRIGSMQLDDAEPGIRLAASRISNATEFPVNMVLASSRGSEQVTDRDILEYEARISARREMFGRPILNGLVRVGQYLNMVPKRSRLPWDMEWPRLRMMSPHEESMNINRAAMTVKAALQAGYIPKKRYLKFFEKNTVPIDTTLILPSSIPDERQIEADEKAAETAAEAAAEKAKQKPKPSGGGGS